MAILETQNLIKAFGALAAVDDVSLAIEAVTFHSIIGPNGAGKTTLFYLLTWTYRSTPCCTLLDEPAAGLAPEETKRLVALVRALKGRYTIVLIEHKMDIIMSVSDRISVMHFGRLIAEGTPAEIQGNREVRRAYLGGVAA